jgi:hypothetical protein
LPRRKLARRAGLLGLLELGGLLEVAELGTAARVPAAAAA